MAMKRTTVYADEDDLAALKDAAARRGVAEAELLRDAIRLVAMSNRTWDDPLFSETHEPMNDANAVLDDVWAEKAAAYERTKGRPL